MPFWSTAQLQGEVETLRKATVELKRKVDDHVALEAQEQVDAEEEVGHSVALSDDNRIFVPFRTVFIKTVAWVVLRRPEKWVCSSVGLV